MKIDNLKSNNLSQPSFKSDISLNLAKAFIKSQENLSSTRFIQDTATNWFPKALFSRSKEDFSEMSFLEFLESAIFYFASPIFGEKLFRNHLFKNIPNKAIASEVNKQIPNSLNNILKDGSISEAVKKQATASKAGIVLACALIPVAEYTLSFAKNLFTLKTFKKSNFNDIANLNKTEKEGENKTQQDKVEKNAIKNLKRGALISAFGILSGLALAKYGAQSDKLQKLSKAILNPGIALSKNIKNEKIKNTISKFSLDFENQGGKLALSKGQLALTAILGLFGYSSAAKDRGKLDVLEVWTRVPLVVFYTIFGSELFEKGFTKILAKKDKFKDVLKTNDKGLISLPKNAELEEIAKNLSSKSGSEVKTELNRLIKQKAFIQLVPYLFSLLFMGVTLSAITRLTTQLRYNKQKKENYRTNNVYFSKLPDVYKVFKNSWPHFLVVV